MVYEYNKIISASELSLLRESVGWNRMEKELSNPIMNSYCNIAVYDENELVGYIDCVSNGVTEAYIQDLMVNPKQQGKGIGTELMNRMIGYLRDNHIYMISVIFEENLMPFYNNFGFNIMLSGQLETYNSNF